MRDDIRPSELHPADDKNQNTQNENSPPVVEKPYSATTESTLPLAEQQEGFVMVPKSGFRNSFKTRFARTKHLSKKQKLIAVVVSVLILGLSGGGVYALTMRGETLSPPPPAPVVEQKVEPPKPTTEASRLTGVQIPIALSKRPITSIQIENSPDARPQSGLRDAGVIFEAIAEGGITRFNASFLEAQPDYIGPIRSVRPYYAVLAAPFDPIFVHAGGSGEGLAKLRDLGLKNLDHGANGAAFRRVSDRYAPHNLYSSTGDLDAAAAKRGYTTSDAKGFVRKEEQKGLPATANTINLAISSVLYNVLYTYDPTTNTYKRTLGGQPHTDLRSNEQLAPKVVVVMATPFSQNGIYSVYQTVGSGAVFIFQDGQAQQGTWSKPSEKEQISFNDATGKPIGLNPGQTWVTLVKTPGNVTFAP